MLIIRMIWKVIKAEVTQSCQTLWNPMDCIDSAGENTGMGSCFLLQGIFLKPGIKPRSPPLQVILYYLSHQGSPRILEWVVYLFSRGSSWPRNPTGFSCIVGGFFTCWVTTEAPKNILLVNSWIINFESLNMCLLKMVCNIFGKYFLQGIMIISLFHSRFSQVLN